MLKRVIARSVLCDEAISTFAVRIASQKTARNDFEAAILKTSASFSYVRCAG
jgi:hypothetical protein